MSAADSGCYHGIIANGVVINNACDLHSNRVYCPYYCDDGYEKTSARAYCAGSETWLPSDNPNGKLCVPIGDATSCLNNRFLDYGYVETLPCRSNCLYNCFRGYVKVANTVNCAPDGSWYPTGSDPSEKKAPCKYVGFPRVSSTTPAGVRTTTRVLTTSSYRGYYDDPSLKINVSPIVFVGAVVGGIAILLALAFAVFFRAYRKSARDARARRYCAHIQSIVQQNAAAGGPDFIDYPDAPEYNDSEFRDIARRIVARTNPDAGRSGRVPSAPSENDYKPPPYETVASPVGSENSPSLVPQQPPGYRVTGQQIDDQNLDTDAREGDIFTSFVFSPSQGSTDLQFIQRNNNHLNENLETDKSDQPPPYETQSATEDGRQSLDNKDPPPPYSVC